MNTDTTAIDAEWDAWHTELIKTMTEDDVPRRYIVIAQGVHRMCRLMGHEELTEFVDQYGADADDAEATENWSQFMADALRFIVGRAELFRRAGLSAKLLPVGVL